MEQTISILKRNGQEESLNLNKIQKRIREQAINLNVNADEVVIETVGGLFNGVTSIQLDELASKIAASKSTIHPDYSKLASNLLVSRLHKEIKSDLSSYRRRASSRLHPEVIEKLKNWHSELSEIVDFSRDFNFDYFGINTMLSTYLIRDENGIFLELPQHVYVRTALYLTNTIEEFKELYDLLSTQMVSFATPILMKAGQKKSSMISCSVHMLKGDSLEDILDTVKEISRHSADSSGIGLCMDNLRSSESKIFSSGGKAHGIVPIAKVIENCMSAYNQCYSHDTEVLTDSGFKLFKDLTEFDLVAQVSEDRQITFIKPLSYTSYEYKGDLYHVKSASSIDLLVTSNHKMAYEKRFIKNKIKNWTNKLELKEISDLKIHNEIAFYGNGFLQSENNLELTYIDRFKIAFQADGVVNKHINKENCSSCWFRFKKERKIDRLINILQKLNLEYTKTIQSDNATVIYIKNVPKNWQIKKFEYNLNNINQKFAEDFIEELSYWDSTIYDNCIRYNSTNKENIDFVQSLGILCNKRTYLQTNKIKKEHHKIQYCLYIKKHQRISPRKTIKEKVNYNGNVYCCEVETGIIIVRRNNKVVLCGNSGLRNGSCAVYLSCWHKDIFDFLELKKPIGDEKKRARDLFLAVNCTNNFMRAVENDEDYWLFCPNDLLKNQLNFNDKSGEIFENEYNKAVELNLGKKIRARDLMRKIAEIQTESGMPYLHFIDNTNDKTNHNVYGKVKQSQLCVSGNTQILTKDGYLQIENLVNKNIEIWNGFEWSNVKPFKTSENAKLVNVKFSNNSEVECTLKHKWLIYDKNNKSIFKETKDLKIDDIIVKHDYPIEFLNTKDINLIKVVSIEDNNKFESTYCLHEPKNNTFLANGVLTGNCIEIMSYTDEKTVAQCCLFAMPVFKYIKDNIFDFDLFRQNTKVGVKYMNRVIERNYYSTDAARKGGLEQRQIGVGILGLADCFFELDLSFISDEANQLNKDIMEHLYYACIESSHEYSVENNIVYDKFENSDFAKGICQFDYWKEDDYKLNLDWKSLKDKMKLGMSNSLLTALMPTATTSNLQSCYECFEPQGSNIFIRKTKSGEFVIFNKFLITDLIKLNIWSDNLRKEIILNEGSVQNIDFLKYFNMTDWTEGRKMLLQNQIEHLKEKFLTVWEIKQKSLINMAKDRSPFVDQSQSMNLYIKSPNLSILTSMYLYNWKAGLKTGIYYLRSQSKLDTNKAFSLNINNTNVEETSMDSELCIGCAV